MRILDIQKHLRATLPAFNESFTDPKSIESVSVTSNVMTVTSTNHGLQVGDDVSIYGIDYVHEVVLTGKSQNTVADFTTAKAIDYGNNSEKKIKLQSNEAYYNGEFDLYTWQNRSLSFQIRASIDAPDSTVERIDVIEPNRCELNAVFTIVSVPDVNTFTVETSFPDTSASELIGGSFYNLNTGVRIVATANVSRIDEQVLQSFDLSNNKMLAVIVADESLVSRSRNIETDSSQRLEYGTDIQMDTWDNFSVLVYAGCANTVDPVEIQDTIRNDIKIALIKCLQGYRPQKTFTNEYDYIYFNGDNLAGYLTAYYVHQFSFGVTIKLNSCDSYHPPSCELKSIQTDYFKDGDLKATDKIIYPINQN